MLPPSEQIRFDDRCPDRPRVGLTVKPPVLRRSTVAVMAAMAVAGVTYGTLVPFNFSRGSELAWRIPLTSLEPGDAAANLFVYIPLGITLRLLFRRRGSWWATECLAALLPACAISYFSEVLQQMLPGRVPTLTDTLCNTAGAAIGTLVAPWAQRRLRHFHAWLHHALQTTPFVAVAGLLNVLICVYALAPFDARVGPAHLLNALGRLHASVDPDLFACPGLSPSAALSKWVGAAACGMLAFLLVMAGRETGRSLLASGWQALSRSCCLVAALELLQLFTASHVADFHDLMRGWACCALFTLAAMLLLQLRPFIYQDPAALVAPTLPIICPIILAWLTVSAAKSFGGGSHGAAQWLPVMANFDRSWDGLLISYSGGGLNYLMAVGVLIAWLRMRGQIPRLTHCLLTALVAAVTLQAVSCLFLSSWPDTGHVALALVAGIAAHRMDRAVFGGSAPKSGSLSQAGWDGAGLSLHDPRSQKDGLESTLSPIGHPHELAYRRGSGIEP